MLNRERESDGVQLEEKTAQEREVKWMYAYCMYKYVSTVWWSVISYRARDGTGVIIKAAVTFIYGSHWSQYFK